MIVLLAVSPESSGKAAAGEKPAGKYVYFEKDKPFLPSSATAEFGDFIDPARVPQAEYCGRCHQGVFKQWRESAHANSFREPFYEKNINLLISSKGIQFTRHCEGCHNPTALFSGSLNPGSKVDRSFDVDGITCMNCHSISKIQNTAGVASYVMAVPAVMVTEAGVPVAGMPEDEEIMARPDLHKRAVMRDIYKSNEFCATCHKAAVPQHLNGYKWLRAFAVYDEWQQSSWARQSPLPFYKKDVVSGCQTCHMMGEDVLVDQAAADGQVASHRWLGANTAIPVIYGYKDQQDLTLKFLQDGLLGIDIFAMARERGANVIAPIDNSSYQISAGDAITFDVVIQNKKIGHSLVPEQRDFYESWVEFTVTDNAGKTLYQSGYLNPDGTLEKRAHSYTNRIISKQGEFLENHEVWAIKARAYDNTIQSGRSDLVRYKMTVPRGYSGKLKITASVLYRRFRRPFMDYVMGKDFQVPIAKMASKELVVSVGQNAAQTTTPPDEMRLRWNNYGIGLLDQQQYALSAAAFRKVTVIAPKYVDGYINVAIAEYSAGQYESALVWLAKAQQLEPGNPRAEFYEGLVYRWQYKFDKAIPKLLKVTAAYPRLRQSRQELGYMYLLKRDYPAAREHYEALQAIDPDDLLAHRYLASVYSALGMKKEAARQSALTADKKEDGAAPWLVQEYWRKNLNIANEVVPYHVHSEDEKEEHRAAQKVLQLNNPPSQIWIQQ